MPKRVLIADDSYDMRQLLCRVFEAEEGFEMCSEAVDGADAVAKARQCRPDLIILDLSMPVMNGLAAARIIHREMPDVPIILYTLYAQAIQQAEAAAAGIRRVVPKTEIMALVRHAHDVVHAA
ncbi:MAG: response regulator [Candidatus Acidiferrales bacterium]